MGLFEQLAEARIQDWQRRGRPSSPGQGTPVLAVGNLEAQLLSEIVELRQQARAEADAERQKALRKRARQLKLQLMVLLESEGRPLAARQIERNLEASEREEPSGSS